MVDLQQLSSWLVVALFLLVVVLIATRRPQHASDRWERLAAWAAKRPDPELEFDDDPLEVAELRESLRTEKLYADIARLRHLVATDTYMSATRQLGNRLAYEQLLAQLADRAKRSELQPVGVRTRDESDAVIVPRVIDGPESLDIRWR